MTEVDRSSPAALLTHQFLRHLDADDRREFDKKCLEYLLRTGHLQFMTAEESKELSLDAIRKGMHPPCMFELLAPWWAESDMTVITLDPDKALVYNAEAGYRDCGNPSDGERYTEAEKKERIAKNHKVFVKAPEMLAELRNVARTIGGNLWGADIYDGDGRILRLYLNTRDSSAHYYVCFPRLDMRNLSLGTPILKLQDCDEGPAAPNPWSRISPHYTAMYRFLLVTILLFRGPIPSHLRNKFAESLAVKGLTTLSDNKKDSTAQVEVIARHLASQLVDPCRDVIDVFGDQKVQVPEVAT